MVDLIKEELRKDVKLGIHDLECIVMPHILINERLFASYKMANDYKGALLTLSKIKTAKTIMWDLYCNTCMKLIPEAEAWLKHKDTVDDMAYLGEWSDYWYNWKQRVDWDEEQKKWIHPVSDGFKTFVAAMVNGTCDDCMFRYAGPDDATCMCHVKDHLYELPQWKLYKCSHFVRDEVEIEDDSRAAGLDPDEVDDETRPDHNELVEKTYAAMNERHQKFYEEQGCPVYNPESYHMVMDEDIPTKWPRRSNDKDSV